MIRRPTKSFGMVGYLSSVVQQIAKDDDDEERREELKAVGSRQLGDFHNSAEASFHEIAVSEVVVVVVVALALMVALIGVALVAVAAVVVVVDAVVVDVVLDSDSVLVGLLATVDPRMFAVALADPDVVVSAV